ncbi:hypothetical protein BY996DRAFT_825351 [Phakopsora pachyrhizi]|uniref:Glycosyl transferase CAP10 domain-containing protein n=1 Tax=Phakopsora pachyrhizi TaxID=170000 RepID=A0AAV0BEC2_PHAPC|nr:hypothetical protein BY996DRAFT_825351 [Phakopsora pachyrhizi]CAH7685604.1 hypothetical protein PPACK8108_LOCUS20162 [Phakopsora pachyrhizi]
MARIETVAKPTARKLPLYSNKLLSSYSPSHLSVSASQFLSNSSGTETSEQASPSSPLLHPSSAEFFTPQTSPLLSQSPSADASKPNKELGNQTADSPSTIFFKHELSHESISRSKTEYFSDSDPSISGEVFFFSKSSFSRDGIKPVTPRGTEIRIDLESGESPLRSPATGISSSVAVLPTTKVIPIQMTETRTTIDFTRIYNQKNTHRRPVGISVSSSLSHDGCHAHGRKYAAPPPISVPSSKEVYRQSFTPSSSQSCLKSFIYSLPSSTSSRAFEEGFDPCEPFIEEIKVFSWPRRFLNLIFGSFIRFLKFLLMPFSSMVYGTEFLQLATSSAIGGSFHHKFRSNRLASLIAFFYVSLSVLIFSRAMSIRFGLIESHYFSTKDLSTRIMIPSKFEELKWLGNFSTTLQFGDERTALKPEVIKTNAKNRILAGNEHRRLDLSSSHEALNLIPHNVRFSKLHSKSSQQFSGNTIPFLFKSTQSFDSNSITACMYTNIFWLERISDFVSKWEGPVSLVLESLEGDRLKLIKMVEKLRSSDQNVRERVNFHLVSIPGMRRLNLEKKLYKMITEPIATNAQLNLARLLSQSEMIWLVGDSRILPSLNLYKKLMENQGLKTRVLAHGNAVVVPTFAFLRNQDAKFSNIGSGFSTDKMKDFAINYVKELFSSIPLSSVQWPQSSKGIIRLVEGDQEEQSLRKKFLVMHEKERGLGKGFTDWENWKKFTKTEDMSDKLGKKPTESEDMYVVKEYDFHYSPNVIISKEGQPWCTERFEFNKAACIYQMYLTGTELWVMPQAWSFTAERMTENFKPQDEALKIKDLISSRLYSKYHQEACMQYGREFLSLDAWDDQRSSHLRAICTQVLNSWGVGVLSEKNSKVKIP